MFRPMRRQKQALTPEACAALLKTETRGVLSLLGDDDYPYGVPVNHWYDPETGRLYFHGGKAGHRVDAAARHDKVSFCVFDRGEREGDDWALHVNCVVIFGRIRPVTDLEETIRISRAISHKFTRDEAYIDAEISRVGAVTQCYEIVIEHMTGKRVKES